MLKQPGYAPRFYRDWVADADLVSFRVVLHETDLQVRAGRPLQARARQSVEKHRAALENYIAAHPDFRTALSPLPVGADAPTIVRAMARAASVAGVGPMAAVAGAIAEQVGRRLLRSTPEVIVENGGDIFIATTRVRRVGIYAGEASRFTGRIGLEIDPSHTPLGIAASSGIVGHSLSFGAADSAIVIAPSPTLADAAATALGNRIVNAEDIPAAVAWAQTIPGISGVLVIKGDHLGAWGNLKLVDSSTQRNYP